MIRITSEEAQKAAQQKYPNLDQKTFEFRFPNQERYNEGNGTAAFCGISFKTHTHAVLLEATKESDQKIVLRPKAELDIRTVKNLPFEYDENLTLKYRINSRSVQTNYEEA